MKRRRLLGWSVVAAALLIIALIVASFLYLGPVRGAEGRQYTAMIHEAAKPLAKESTTLANLTDKLIEKEPTQPIDSTKSAVEAIRGHMTVVRGELKTFESSVHAFSDGVSLPTTTDYRNATVIHARSLANIAQFRQTLDEYDQFLSFLVDTKERQQPLVDALASFNAQTDLNTLGGTSDAFRHTAKVLRQQSDQIKVLSAPEGMKDVQLQLVAVHIDAAVGFEALANSLSPPIDADIYAAAGKIEAATREFDEMTRQFEIVLEKHPILKDVRDLPEKVSDL